MTWFGTNSVSDWTLKGDRWGIGDGSFVVQEKNILIAPEVPYMYAPTSDMPFFMQQMEKLPDTIVCDSPNNRCYWNRHCDEVRQRNPNLSPYDVKFRILDSATGSFYNQQIEAQYLLVPGVYLDVQTTDRCYFGIFENAANDNTFYIGTAFMKGKYVIFDQSPYDQYSKNYIQIGIGAAEPDVDIAKIRYDYNDAKYAPELKTDDTSTVMAGYADQYDQTPVVPDPVKPIQPDNAKNQTDNESKALEPTIHPHTPFDKWMQENMTLVIIAGSAIVLLLIIVAYCCCCRKGTAEKKTDPYMYKTYSVNEEAVPLDNENIQ